MSEEKVTEAHTEALEGSLEPIEYAVKNTDGSPSKPLLKCPKTGKWLKGTGAPAGGGRKKGSKDKITRTMIDMATATLEQSGERMWQDLAASDPVACLALITKLLPNQELSEAIQQSDGDTNQQLRDITVRLVSDIPNALDYQSPAIEDKSEVDQ
jgi:hypothetical protein